MGFARSGDGAHRDIEVMLVVCLTSARRSALGDRVPLESQSDVQQN
jgi:hypothetical protein